MDFNGYSNGTNGYSQNGNGYSGLVDWTGQPVRRDVGDGLNPKSGYDGFALPHVLQFSANFGSVRGYLRDAWDQALKTARQDALAMEFDSGLMGPLQERMLAVATLPGHVHVPDEKDPVQMQVKSHLQKIIEQMCGPEELFINVKMNLLWGIWYGRQGAKAKWGWTTQDGIKTLCLREWGPLRGDKISHLKTGEPAVDVYGGSTDRQFPGADITTSTNGARVLVLNGDMSWGWRSRVIIHRHDCIDRDFFDAEAAEAAMGSGVRNVVFWLDWICREWLARQCDAVDRTALGTTIWYYKASDNAARIEAENAAKAMTDRTNILVPVFGNENRPSIERLEVPTAGLEFLSKLREEVRETQRNYIVGQSMSTGGSKQTGGDMGGSHRAQFAVDTKDQIRNLDARRLDATLTGSMKNPGVLSMIQYWTFPQTWPSDQNPNGFRASWVTDLEDKESKEKLEAGKVLWEMGVDLKVDELRAAAGFSKPAEGDEVAAGKAPEPAGMGMGGPGQPGAPGQPPSDDGPFPRPAQPPAGHAPQRAPFAAARDGDPSHYDGRWVTAGGGPGPDGEKHAGGTPVKIGPDGTVEVGPRKMKGKSDDNSGGVSPAKTSAPSPRLTPQQTEAVSDYTGGYAFRINTALRGGVPLTGKLKAIDDHLQSSFANVPPGDSQTVFRGMPVSPEAAAEFARQAKAAMDSGKPLHSAGYMSATKNERDVADVPVSMKIATRHGLDVSGISKNADEQEVLINRGANLKINKVEKRPDGGWHIEAEHMPQTATSAQNGTPSHYARRRDELRADHGYRLARAYAALWNRRGGEVPEPELEAAGAGLGGTDWVLHWDESRGEAGRWRVYHADDGQFWRVDEGEQAAAADDAPDASSRSGHPEDYAAHTSRAPRGGVHINGRFYRGGQFIPRQFTVTGSTPGVSALADRPKDLPPVGKKEGAKEKAAPAPAKTEPVVTLHEAGKKLAAMSSDAGPDFVDMPLKTVSSAPFKMADLDRELEAGHAKKETVRLADLHTDQTDVSRAGVTKFLADPTKRSTGEALDDPHGDRIVVARVGGKLYLGDGNHRATAASLRGMETLPAYIVDLPATPATQGEAKPEAALPAAIPPPSDKAAPSHAEEAKELHERARYGVTALGADEKTAFARVDEFAEKVAADGLAAIREALDALGVSQQPKTKSEAQKLLARQIKGRLNATARGLWTENEDLKTLETAGNIHRIKAGEGGEGEAAAVLKHAESLPNRRLERLLDIANLTGPREKFPGRQEALRRVAEAVGATQGEAKGDGAKAAAGATEAKPAKPVNKLPQ